MKYVAMLFALAVTCMLAVPALAAQNGNCNGDCIRECTTDCPNVPPHDGTGNQNGNGQNGNPDGQAQDGTGPIGDGSCKA
jgi:hypothetical protein